MQTRIQSAIESFVSSAIGFAIAWLCNRTILPLFGFRISTAQSFWVTVIFTIISIVRVYLVRRFFARLHKS